MFIGVFLSVIMSLSVMLRGIMSGLMVGRMRNFLRLVGLKTIIPIHYFQLLFWSWR